MGKNHFWNQSTQLLVNSMTHYVLLQLDIFPSEKYIKKNSVLNSDGSFSNFTQLINRFLLSQIKDAQKWFFTFCLGTKSPPFFSCKNIFCNWKNSTKNTLSFLKS